MDLTIRSLEVGDVVQLKPDHEKFPACLVVVTEPKSWGCQGFLMSAYDLGESACKFKGRAFVRPKAEDFEYVGKMQWMLEEDMEEE